MKHLTPLFFAAALSMAAVVSGCKADPATADPATADPTPKAAQELAPEMTAYANAAIDEFYDYDLDALLARIDSRVTANLSIDDLEQLADQAHETAQPARKTISSHQYSEGRGGLRLVTLQYSIPNKAGREQAVISLSYDETSCCKLVGFRLKADKE